MKASIQPQKSRNRGLLLGMLVAITAAVLAPQAVASALQVSGEHADPALRFAPAGWPHLLGCDQVGRDFLVRLLLAARTSFLIAVGGATLAAVGGAVLALTGVALGRRMVQGLNAFADVVFAIPVLPALFVVAAAVGRRPAPGAATAILTLVVLVALTSWVHVVRVLVAAAERVLVSDVAAAAVGLGATRIAIVRRHVLPVLRPLFFATWAVDVGRAFLSEAAFSFLGLGVPPLLPSLGNLLRGADAALADHPALAFWPGLCILVLTAACMALGRRWASPARLASRR